MLGGKFQSGTSVQWCRSLTRHISIPRLTSTSPLYAPRPRDHTRRRGSGADCPLLRWVLCYPVEHFLARTGGSNGRWDGRKLPMTQDARDHRLVGHSSNDPERTAAAERTGGHSQTKHAPQQPRPAPARSPSTDLTLIHPLLMRCWNDGPAQLTVRREAARIRRDIAQKAVAKGCLKVLYVSSGRIHDSPSRLGTMRADTVTREQRTDP